MISDACRDVIVSA